MALHEAVLSRCFEDRRGREVMFASGQRANNIVDLERVANIPMLRKEVGYQVVRLIDEMLDGEEPDLIVPVPEGANWLGEDVAKAMGCSVLLLDKDKETREISYKPGGEAKVAESEGLVIVDDVLNELTSSGRVYSLPGMAERTLAIAGILDRNPHRYCRLPVPVGAVIVQNIPAELPGDSPLWSYVR